MASLKSPITLVMILVIGILVCVFISTDKEGNPILDEDEKEFQEFLNSKNKIEEKKVKPTKKTVEKTTKKKGTKKK